MGDVLVATSVRRLAFTREQATQLLGWIIQFPGDPPEHTVGPVEAALRHGDDVQWEGAAKRAVLHAIDQWMLAAGSMSMPEPALDLKYELMRDIREQPLGKAPST